MRRVLLLSARAFAGLLVILAGIGVIYEPNTEIPAGARGRHVVVRGVPLRVVQQGSGPDVLLIHGSPGCVEDWEPLIHALSAKRRVTAYDRPGHGYSGDGGQYSYAYNADIALALIAELGLRDVTVVGHSFGGTAVLALAVRGPEDIHTFWMVDGGAYEPPGRPGPIFALLEPPWIGMGFAAVLGAPIARARIREETPKMFRLSAPPAGFVELRTQLFSTPKSVHALGNEWRGAAGWLAQQNTVYSAIRTPLHIVPQADDAFRRTTAERLHGEVASSTLTLMPGTGHHIQIEKAAELAALILDPPKRSPD